MNEVWQIWGQGYSIILKAAEAGPACARKNTQVINAVLSQWGIW